MKKVILLFLSLVLFLSCTEEIDFRQAPGQKPNTIESISFVPLLGKVAIEISTTQIDDYIYTRIDYEIREGVKRSLKMSKYESVIMLEGFAKEGLHKITLTPVSKGEVAGSSTEFEVMVNKPAYVNTFEQLDPYFSFGSIGVRYVNEGKDDLIIHYATYHEDAKQILTDANKQVGEESGKVSFLNIPMVSKKYYFYVTDRFGNISDTTTLEGGPLFEEELSRATFKNFSIPHYNGATVPYGGAFSDFVNLYDGVLNNISGGSAFYSAAVLNSNAGIAVNIGIDFGKSATVSRFKMFHVLNDNWWLGATMAFAQFTPKIFELWGSNTAVAGENTFDTWTKIGDFESTKPVGMSAIDLQNYACLNGEDFLIDEPIGPFRYYRVVVKSTWASSLYVTIDELKFYGSFN